MEGLSNVLVEVLVIIAMTAISLVSTKVISYINRIKSKEELVLANEIIDALVVYAEKELIGVKGKEKREYVVDKAVELLQKRGVKLDSDVVIATIEKVLAEKSFPPKFDTLD